MINLSRIITSIRYAGFTNYLHITYWWTETESPLWFLSSHLCCSDLTYNPSVVWVTAEIKRTGGNLRLPALSEHFLSKRWAYWLTNCGLSETTGGIRGEECLFCPASRWDASTSLALLTSIPLLYKLRESSPRCCTLLLLLFPFQYLWIQKGKN